MSPFISNSDLAYLFSSSFGMSNEEAKIARVRFVLDRTRGSRGGKGAASTDMAELCTAEQGGASRIQEEEDALRQWTRSSSSSCT